MKVHVANLCLTLALVATPGRAHGPVPEGTEFQVNSYTPRHQRRSSVAAASEGFVVVWQSYGSGDTDNSDSSVQAQRLEIPVFADGFDSGDTFNWSASVP